jgi:BlaI family penicillinase repressor
VARPKHEHPTPAELEILKVVWNQGPLTVRQVLDSLGPNRPRAYTSVMSLLNVMTEKGLVVRQPQGRAFLYEASVPRDKTLGAMVADLLGRAFEGSATSLVAHLLEQAHPTEAELDQIREAVQTYRREQGTK